MTFTSCKKEKLEEPPQQTQNGSNILWCKINGTPVTVRGKSNAVNGKGLSIADRKKIANLQATFINASSINDNQDDLRLIFNNYNITNLGTKYKIVTINNTYYSALVTEYFEYEVDSTRSWAAFSRFDGNVVAGTFEFHGVSANGETVSITEGWFDIAL